MRPNTVQRIFHAAFHSHSRSIASSCRFCVRYSNANTYKSHLYVAATATAVFFAALLMCEYHYLHSSPMIASSCEQIPVNVISLVLFYNAYNQIPDNNKIRLFDWIGIEQIFFFLSEKVSLSFSVGLHEAYLQRSGGRFRILGLEGKSMCGLSVSHPLHMVSRCLRSFVERQHQLSLPGTNVICHIMGIEIVPFINLID